MWYMSNIHANQTCVVAKAMVCYSYIGRRTLTQRGCLVFLDEGVNRGEYLVQDLHQIERKTAIQTISFKDLACSCIT